MSHNGNAHPPMCGLPQPDLQAWQIMVQHINPFPLVARAAAEFDRLTDPAEVPALLQQCLSRVEGVEVVALYLPQTPDPSDPSRNTLSDPLARNRTPGRILNGDFNRLHPLDPEDRQTRHQDGYYLPMVSGGQALGVLAVGAVHPCALDPDRLDALMHLASLAATALRRLYDEGALAQHPDRETGPLFDPEAIRTRVMDDRGLYQTLVSLMAENSPKQTARMRKAVSLRDGVMVHAAAHTMKSGLGTFGSAKTVALCQHIEELAHAEDFERIPALVDRLERLLDRLLDDLRAFSW